MKASAQEVVEPSMSGITQRQQQILKLMRAGKVNKEIASELGIGLGTVKQHVVALFKKLNVTNRAMAASSGMNLTREVEGGSATIAADGLLERRPCVVLSVALPDDVAQPVVRRLHEILASLAFDNDALFLARKGNSGDVIFGIQRSTEYDLLMALRIVDTTVTMLSTLSQSSASRLSAGLTAGLAVASMKRHGGWSGEAIASPAIFSSRELLEHTEPGQIAIGLPVRELISAFGIGDVRQVPDKLALSELKTFGGYGESFDFPLIDRKEEMSKLKEALGDGRSGLGRLFYLEGETGMGKSRLCRAVMERCLNMAGNARFFRCQPLSSDQLLINVSTGDSYPVENIASMLRSPAERYPDLIIVDDFSMLTSEKRSLLSSAAAEAVTNGKLVIFSGRARGDGTKAGKAETFRLGRLSASAIGKLVRMVAKHYGMMESSRVKAISSLAAGVPLFAVELSKRCTSNTIGLPLLVVICARLDKLQLDKKILSAVARHRARTTPDDVAVKLGEDIEDLRSNFARAVASGVLVLDEEGRLMFSHPLIAQAINELSME